MGRCGGLKEGGHHRKALDVAAKKRAEKTARREAQVDAGVRAITLNKILALDPDVDVYLDARPESSSSGHGRPICKSYFRSDRCGNRRCKFSHEYSIADAVICCTTIPATTASNAKQRGGGEESDDDTGGSIPAIELIPGIHNSAQQPRQKRHGSIIKAPIPGAAGYFEEISEPIVRTIVAFCPSDSDVVRMVRSCRFIRQCLLDCRDVKRRRDVVADERLAVRNNLLMKRATGARLRFAVSNPRVDVETGLCTEEEKECGRKSSGRKKGGGAKRIRPILAFDFENADVFRAFESSFQKKPSDLQST